jgi:hypothetical protein
MEGENNLIAFGIAITTLVVFHWCLLYRFKFSSRTKRNVFYAFFVFSYVAVVTNAIRLHSFEYLFEARDRMCSGLFCVPWERTVIIDAPMAVVLNLLVLWLVWWIIAKFAIDFRKDRRDSDSRRESA